MSGQSPIKDYSVPAKLNSKTNRQRSQYKTTKLVKVTRLHTRKGSENINPKAANKLVNKPLENSTKNNSVINEAAMDPRASSFSKVGTQSEISGQIGLHKTRMDKSGETINSAEKSKLQENK